MARSSPLLTSCRSRVTVYLLIISVLSCHGSTEQSGQPAVSKAGTRHPMEQMTVTTHAETFHPYMSLEDDERYELVSKSDLSRLVRDAEQMHQEEAEEKGDESEDEREERHHEREYESEEPFLLGRPRKVIKTEAGELQVIPHESIPSDLRKKKIGLGFLELEPKALLLPLYIDAHCLFLVHKGKGQLSWVDNGSSQEVDLEEGDVFRIQNGRVFHVYNNDEGQRLSIFGIFDLSAVYAEDMFHNFFVAGGQKPTSVLSGFSKDILARVFKAPTDEVQDVLSSQTKGPIIYFSPQNESDRLPGLRNFVAGMLDKLTRLPNIFPGDSRDKPYNIFKKKPDFSNDFGSTTAIHGDDFKVLKEADKGVFMVRLKAGAVLAPHWNPKATEVALVTKGDGEIQIVYPNGTAAAAKQVQKGDVFSVPQHFPMCQIASRNGQFEFVGFSTSSSPNSPQFLAGANSVLKVLDKEVSAMAFNLPSDDLEQFLDLQREAVILPGEPLQPSSSSSSSSSAAASISVLSKSRKEQPLD